VLVALGELGAVLVLDGIRVRHVVSGPARAAAARRSGARPRRGVRWERAAPPRRLSPGAA
jgi:hypothetical protein